MEQIINFFEEYWGYTLVGGVTLGTIITFIITQIKVLISGKVKNAQVNSLMDKIEKQAEELSIKEVEKQHVQEELTRAQKEQLARDKYFNQVQATTFKAISYIVLASKLDPEDKIKLQNEFSKLMDTKLPVYQEVINESIEMMKDVAVDAVTNVKEDIVDDALNTVVDTAEQSQTLMDKYTKEV